MSQNIADTGVFESEKKYYKNLTMKSYFAELDAWESKEGREVIERNLGKVDMIISLKKNLI